MDQPEEMDIGKTLHCLEALHALQTDSRASDWYWGDVCGEMAVGSATTVLWRQDLICPRVGPPLFRLTPKGEAFLKAHKKAWEAFLSNTDRHGTPLSTLPTR